MNDVINELESLLNHYRVVPASVPINISHRMTSFPLEISIYAQKALRWASESPSPVNGETFGIMKCGGMISSMIPLTRGCPSS